MHPHFHGMFFNLYSVMPEPGGPGGPWPPQYLADRLTLFQPWGADSAHPLLVAPPMFFTFRHHCLVVYVIMYVTYTYIMYHTVTPCY